MATYWENSCSFGLRYVSWYKYLIVSLVFSHLGFWSGNLFLIAPFPDLCLLVPFYSSYNENFHINIKNLVQHIMNFSHYIMHTIQHIIKCEQDIMTMMNQMFLFLTIRQLWRSIARG